MDYTTNDKHEYVLWDVPRVGTFRVHVPDGTYTLGEGWEQAEEKITIIGEDNDTYIYEVRQANHGEWVKDLGFLYHQPGYYASRFVRTMDGKIRQFKCRCGCERFERPKGMEGLTYYEGHYWCQGCRAEHAYHSESFTVLLKYDLPVGIHKSRLIRWEAEPVQLKLF